MMTIMHIITGLERGGAETMLIKLVRAMKPMGVTSCVVSLMGPGVYGPELEREGVKVWSLNVKRGVPDPMALLQLVRILRQTRPDLIQTWLYHADLIGLMGSILTGTRPLCWNIRCSNMDMTYYSWLSKWIPVVLSRLSFLPDAILVNSHVGKKMHESIKYKPKAWHVIPNGFDMEKFRPDATMRNEMRTELGFSDTVSVIGMIARFDPTKDHAGFLNAAESLAARNQNVRFVLAGLKVTPDNPAFARTFSGALKGRVSLLGPQADMPRLMNAFDILCLPSGFGEGFPNVIGEAMACGVPCVATDVGDSAIIVSDTGSIVPPFRPAALTEALQAMLDLEPDSRKKLGGKARAHIEKEYSISSIACRYHAVYADLISRRSTVRP